MISGSQTRLNVMFLLLAVFLKSSSTQIELSRLRACPETIKCLHQQAAYHCGTALSSTRHFPHAKILNQNTTYWTFGWIAGLLLRTDNDKHEINNSIWIETYVAGDKKIQQRVEVASTIRLWRTCLQRKLSNYLFLPHLLLYSVLYIENMHEFATANNTSILYFPHPYTLGNHIAVNLFLFLCFLDRIFLLFNFSSSLDFGLSPGHHSLDALIIQTASAIKAIIVLFELLS